MNITALTTKMDIRCAQESLKGANMKSILKLFTLSLCVIFLVACQNKEEAPKPASANNRHAASTKEEYELQERCGKRAEEFFNRGYGNGISNTKDGQSISGYTSHYNKKMNKCFFLLTTSDLPYKDKKKSASTFITLIDINEQKEYGNFFKRLKDNFGFVCKVADKVCNSQDEWDALIKPYMEE
jgi:hypothetical protein